MVDKINSFIDDEDDCEYEYEEIDEIIEEDEDEAVVEQEVVSEALKRIEQAKLYESLLKHDFFAEGSARPQIQNKVTSEIRSFILDRLNILLGMKPAAEAIVQAKLPFSNDQVQALIAIADRLVSKNKTPQPVSHQPVINQFNSGGAEVLPKVNRPVEPIVNQVESEPRVVRKIRKIRKKIEQPKRQLQEGELQGTYRVPVDNSERIPMASPAQEAQKFATEVDRNMRGTGGSKMLNLAIGAAQKKNRNIIEED